jgi:hypothetical protein
MADPIVKHEGMDEMACPPRLWQKEHICDTTFLTYTYNLRVDNRLVEVTLRYRIERCTEDYVLSDLVHSMTLFPGEEVFLSTRTRHSIARLTDDSSVSASQVSRSSDRVWMESFKSMATNFSETQSGFASASSHSEYSKTDVSGSAGVNLLFFSVGGGASHASGEFDASSSSQFFNSLNQHLTSSVHQTNAVTRDTMSVSLTQINSHRAVTSESKEELEVSTRRFRNENLCHTVTHYFYQIAKRQHVRVTLESRTLRPLNSFADTVARMKPFRMSIAANAKLDFSQPVGVNPGIAEGAKSQLNSARVASLFSAGVIDQIQNVSSIPAATFEQEERARLDALARAEKMLADLPKEYTYESTDIIPTDALYVESELGECMICEPFLVTKHEYELERMRLENLKLQKEIELLEKSREYRCCDDDDDTTTGGTP